MVKHSKKHATKEQTSKEEALALAREQISRSYAKKTILILIAILLVLGAVSAAIKLMETPKNMTTKVLLETSMGNITIEMYTDMPITTGNFVTLVNKGFYDGVIFHRIIDGFMLQGGDPTGTGMGGPGYKIKDEFAPNNKNNKYTISMANSGPNTGGSQFFINLVNNNFLDGKHPVFGRVTAGMDVVDAIGKVDTDRNDKPLTPVVIKKATVIILAADQEWVARYYHPGKKLLHALMLAQESCQDLM